MDRGHAIEALSFDFAFANEEEARARHASFGDRAASSGVAVIDQVFDEFDGGERISIDELNLDLGTVNEANESFEDQLRRHLRDALRDAVRLSVPVGGADARSGLNTGARKGEGVARRPGKLEDVWHLLTTGHLPWRYTTADAAVVDALVDAVLAGDGEALAARVRSSSQRSRLMTRIARQWTPAQRRRLTALAGLEDDLPAERLAVRSADQLRLPQRRGDSGDRSRPGFADETTGSPVDRALAEHGALLAAILRQADDMPRIMAAIARDWSAPQRERLLAVLALAARSDEVGTGSGVYRTGDRAALDSREAIAGEREHLLALLALAPRPDEIGARGGVYRSGDRAVLDSREIVAAALAKGGARFDGNNAPRPGADNRLGGEPGDPIGRPFDPEPMQHAERDGASSPAPAKGEHPVPLDPPIDHEAGAIPAATRDRLEDTYRLIAAARREIPEDETWWQASWADAHPGPAAIEALHHLDGGTARALLEQLAARPEWVAAISRLDDRALWRTIVTGFGGTEFDADFLDGLIATLAVLARSGDPPESDIAGLLRADLLALLVASGGATLDRPVLAAALLAGEARRREVASATLARELIAAWPEATRSLVAADLAGMTGRTASPRAYSASDSASASAQRQWDRLLVAARWPDFAACESSEQDLAWLADRLRQLGTSAAWRRDFAARLDPRQVEPLLALWLAGGEVAPLARLLVTPDAWQPPEIDAPVAELLLEWLLTQLVRAQGPVVSAAKLVETLVLRRAEVGKLDPAVVAASVDSYLAADGQAAGLARALAARWHGIGQTGEALDPHVAARAPLSAGSLAWLLAPDRTAPPAVTALDDGARRRLFEALAPDRAAHAFALVDRLRIAWTLIGHKVAMIDSDWQLLRRALFGREPTLDAAAFVAAWAAPRLVKLRADLRERAGDFLAKAAMSFSSRPMPPPPAADAPGRAALTYATAETTGDARAGESRSEHRRPRSSGEGAIDGLRAAPDEVFDAAWYAALPNPIPDEARRRIRNSLVPPAAGLARLSGLPEAARRQLLERLHFDAAPALGMLDMLDAHWRSAGLRTASADEPTRALRLVLRLLFHQERRLDAFTLAEAWLDARLGEAPAGAQTAGLERLAVPGAILPGLGTDRLLHAALLRALRRAGIATRQRPEPEAVASTEEPAVRTDETMYVGNAGLVLIGPYVGALFARLGLTAEDAFVDEAAMRRAVHILELVVDGTGEALEPQLTLNKLLCGLDLALPVEREFTATEEERAVTQELLEAVIGHWGSLGNTTVAGLREAFLQRPGELVRREEDWLLTVETRTLDVLIDSIPWSFRTLKLPWMPEVLHVEWR